MRMLRLSMIGTLMVVIAVSTLALALILDLVGAFSVTTLLALTAVFNLAQWLLAPYVVESIYKVRELGEYEYPWLHEALERLSAKSGIRKPKLMISDIDVPNAFAYGSPLTGNRVAVTRGLLELLDRDEVEAVIGHEIGHLRHRDVQIMTFLSLLPSLFYLLGRTLMYSAYYEGRREERGGGLLLLGVGSMIVYFVLSLLVLHFSRLREYYADYHSVMVAPDRRRGAYRLMEALAKIVDYTSRMKAKGRITTTGFRELLIIDPETSIRAASELRGDRGLVERVLRKEVTWADSLLELFSTHPNIVKRLKALEELARG